MGSSQTSYTYELDVLDKCMNLWGLVCLHIYLCRYIHITYTLHCSELISIT